MKEPILEMRGITKTIGSVYTVVPRTIKFLLLRYSPQLEEGIP